MFWLQIKFFFVEEFRFCGALQKCVSLVDILCYICRDITFSSQQKISQIEAAKIKEGIFVWQQIRQFKRILRLTEFWSWMNERIRIKFELRFKNEKKSCETLNWVYL